MNPLREGKLGGEVDRVRLATHVAFPRVVSAFAATAGQLFAAKGAVDRGAACWPAPKCLFADRGLPNLLFVRRLALFAPLLSALALALTGIPSAWGQNAEPIPEDELSTFLGRVPSDHFTWSVVHSIDFDVYHGKANPPLNGSVGFYIGGWPQDLTPGQAVRSRLGRYTANWQRSIGADGSIEQETIISFGGALNAKAHVWAKAPNAQELEKLVAVIGQLPTFSSGMLPARFQGLEELFAKEQRIRPAIWICWPLAALAVAWFVDRRFNRHNASVVVRLLRFAGVIAVSIAATICAAHLWPIVVDWLVIARGIFLLGVAAIVLVVALVLASGLYLVRRLRKSTAETGING